MITFTALSSSLTPVFLYCFTGLLGLICGSFANVVIHRLPLGLNLVHPFSHCPQCQTRLKFWHNIPLLSFLILKTRCYFCKQKIPYRYPLTELLTAFGFLWSVCHFGFNAMGAIASVFWFFLLCMSVIDFEHFILPDELTLSGLWLGLLINGQGFFQHTAITSPSSAILGAVLGYTSLWALYWLHKWITKKEGLGYGDFKLLAMIGAWLGFEQLPNVILLSSIAGSLYGLIRVLCFKKISFSHPIPFGPFLALGAWAGFLTC